MTLVGTYSLYNPGKVLSNVSNKEEYDYLFSAKQATEVSKCAYESIVSSITDISNGFIEMFSGNPSADPGKVGELQRIGTTYAAGFQASLGIAKLLTGDVYSGVYNSLLGILGVSCSRQGKNKEMLKTYVVITFINGCVQAMEFVQVSLLGIQMFGHGIPFIVSLGYTVTILNPCASFLGAYIGWQCIKAAKQQYMLALAQYHLQMLMMQQHQQMMQAASIQAQQRQIKRLPPITEDAEEEVVECTGGSQSISE